VPFPYAGEIYALLAPLCWSIAVILYRKSAGVAPLAMNLFKNTFALVLLSLTLVAAGIPIPFDRSALDWFRLIASGVLGLGVADTLLFEGLQRVGAARVAVVDTIYAPLMVTLSWLVLGEELGGYFLVGAVAVVIGVALATIERPGGMAPAGHWVGTLYVVGGIVGTAAGVLLSKPVLEGSNLIEVTWTRLLFGTASMLVFVGARREWTSAFEAFRPSPVWRTLVPGAFIGTYLSLVLWLGGFKWANASVASVLNQVATVYILVLARVVLGETLRTAQVVGGGLAAAGALWIVLTR
jgi:drug/metabolite transporter (DMT)-like permease